MNLLGGTVMKVRQAAEKWEVTRYQAEKICKHMGLDPRNIPESAVPVYVPDGRYKTDPHRHYVFVLDVIINTHMALEGIDGNIIETCVVKLREAGLIVLKHGKETGSADYRDYMISPDRELFYNWKNCKMKEKINVLVPIVSAVTDGVSAAVQAAASA